METDNFSSSAPSYALESDSGESDWNDDLESTPAPSKIKKVARKVEVELSDKIVAGSQVTFLVGEAGERLNVRVAGDGVKVSLDGEQVGSIHQSSSNTTTTLVFLSTAIPLASLHPLVTFLLKSLAPSNTTILSSYHFPSYTSSTAPLDPDNPPILYLRSISTPSIEKLKESKLIQPFSPPNLLHGLPASLLSLSSLLSPSASSLLLLFPTASVPEPLNGPWSNNSTLSTINATSLYDVGPLADGNLMISVKNEISEIGKELGWSWLEGGKGGEKGFSWLEKIRKVKRREHVSSMYM